MKVKLNPNSRGIIKTVLGEYHRAVENSNHIFFVNFEEDNENHQVKMFDRKRNLVSDDYSAFVELKRVLKETEYSWISERMKKVSEKMK